MRPAVVERLLEVNRAFYQTLGDAFAATRPRPQPGVARVLRQIPAEASVLDLGCGHGLVAETLAAAGHEGRYVGLDAAPGLLTLARERIRATWATFREVDLARAGWRSAAGLTGSRFDWVLAFAFLHHIPGEALRQEMTMEMTALAADHASLAVSVWDFRNSDRLQARVVRWEEIGLRESDVEPGDALLDWRAGGHGLRYVHHFTLEELSELAGHGGFTVLDSFWSDGEGGRLGLYQVWQPAVE